MPKTIPFYRIDGKRGVTLWITFRFHLQRQTAKVVLYPKGQNNPSFLLAEEGLNGYIYG